MRILFVTRDLQGQGANFIRATGLARALITEGLDVTVLAGKSSGIVEPAVDPARPIKIISYPDFLPKGLRRSGLGLTAPVRNALHILRQAFDVVQIYGFRPMELLPALGAHARKKTALVVDWSDWWGYGGIASQRRWYGKATTGLIDHLSERWCLRMADGAIAVTSHLAGLAERWGVQRDQILIIPTGVDVERIRPLAKAAMRKKYGLDGSARIVVHSGLSEFDVPALRQVLDRIHAREPQAHFMIIGIDRARLARSELGSAYSDRVIRFDRVPHEQLGELLACGDVMLLPFTRGGFNLARFPNRLGDYLAAGRPVVTNLAGDVGHFLRRIAAGLVVENGPEAMANAVARLLNDPGLAVAMGARGRSAAEDELNWKVIAPRVASFYRRLLNGGDRDLVSGTEDPAKGIAER